ncbi:MAG: LPS export ABC transporter permease LptG [Candidatus Arsenophonus melophagi]|nr:LPS export ABC transporter permease LptG [Candidatus Arsenophonus melophagi]
MFGVLDKYIGRTIFCSILMTLFILVVLSGIIKFVEQLRKVGDGDYSTWNAGTFTLLTVPRDIELLFPMAGLLGSLLGLGTLATRSELLVMQAVGFSRLQVAMSVMKTAIPLLSLTIVIGEWIAPEAEQWARNYRTEKIFGRSLIAKDYSLWAKDGNDFIHIQHIFATKNKIKEVSIYQFNAQKKLQAVIFAASGDYNSNTRQWQLSQVDSSWINNKKDIINSQSLVMDWKTNLSPEKLGVVSLGPDALAIRRLYQYIKYLNETGQESAVYTLSMWKKILSPISVAVMMLMSLSFIFGPLRSVTMGARVLIGILGGFIFYLLNEGFGNLSLVYGIVPLIAAISPSVLFFVLSILLLIRRK